MQSSYTRITLEKRNTWGPSPGGSARGPVLASGARLGKVSMPWNPAPGLRVQGLREPSRERGIRKKEQKPVHAAFPLSITFSASPPRKPVFEEGTFARELAEGSSPPSSWRVGKRSKA